MPKTVRENSPHGVQTLRTDNGLEFVNRDVKELTRSLGIRHEKTVAYSPEQNGAAERENRTVVETARTLLHAKRLNIKLWAEAVNTAVHVLNRTGPSTVKGVTPYELWHKKQPDISHLRVFGEEVYTHIPKEKRQKWDPKAERGLLVGYDEETKGYRIWFQQRMQVRICRDVKFTCHRSYEEKNEDDNYTLLEIPKEASMSQETMNHDAKEHDGSNQEPLEVEDNQELHRVEEEPRLNDAALESHRGYNLRDRNTIQKPTRYSDAQSYCKLLSENNEPCTYKEAINCDEAASWKQAMNEEIKSLKKTIHGLSRIRRTTRKS